MKCVHGQWYAILIGLGLILSLILTRNSLEVNVHRVNSEFPSKEMLSKAANFLQKLFNPSKNMCRETFVPELHIVKASNDTTYVRYTNETYWIASDNYLACLALMPYNQTLSNLINETISSYYDGPLTPYQILEGKSIPLTLHVPNIYVLENTTDQFVVLNVYNGTVDKDTYLDYPAYGDTLVYQAINYYIRGYPYEWCKKLYLEAYKMFDGIGVRDAHYKNTTHYDNMKLALLIFGAKVLNLTVDLTEIEQRLWLAQKSSGEEAGGITSITNATGHPVGTANCETTALTLIAYNDALIERIQQKRPTEVKRAIEITFSCSSFNETSTILANITAIPLLGNFTVTINNNISWTPNQDNPRIAIGLFSSLAYPQNLSIQIVEYSNHDLDVVIHNVTYPHGYKIIEGKWENNFDSFSNIEHPNSV